MEAVASKRWQGLLANELEIVRRSVTIVLVAVALFMPIGSLGFYPAAGTHLLVSLIPIALAALLFGKWKGCAIGAIVGVSEMAHATLQPYNYYEKFFSLPWNSIVLCTLFGLVTGALFACVWRLTGRQSPVGSRSSSTNVVRLVALVVAIAIGSLLFTVCLQGGIRFAISLYGMSLPDELTAQLLGTKSVVEQICLHTLIITVPVVLTSAAVDRYSNVTRKLSVRTTFQIWFGVLTALFFFVASGVAYTAVTSMSLVNMNAALADHLGSLAKELSERDGIVNTLYERGVMEKEELRSFSAQAYRNIDCDLPGWSEEVVAMAADDVIIASTDESLVGVSLADSVTPGLGNTTYEEAIETDEAVEYYQGPGCMISYLRADELAYERLGGSGVYQLVAIVPSSETFLNRALYMYLVAGVFLALLGAVFLVAMRLLDRVVVREVDSTNRILGRITAGELDQRIPDSNSYEFSSLSSGINTTVGALENSIAEANARIDRELAAARAIQQSALPTAQPPFPHIESFDLYANMEPAREVGGDFYDYFELSGGRVGFVVADVSGKGMPAALFMMAAKTAIRGAMEAKSDLATAIGIANRSLCQGNEAEMFVTAFAGVFEYRTGRLVYVNAGHNKPLVLHDGAWSWVTDRSGPYLGSFDWVDYNQFEMQLEPGDELFVYTDGVNEAFNVDEECYGNERLEAFLASHADLHPRRLLRTFRAELGEWAHGADQSDDITMLALKNGIPPEYGASLVTTANLDNFEQIEGFVEGVLDKVGCPPKVANHVLVAIEELVVNVCSYAYPNATPDQPGPLRIHVTHQTDPNAIVVEVGDDGVPFDPFAREDPQRPESIEEAKIGGLGLVMTKKFMDEYEYVRVGTANSTIVTKRWD